MGRVSTEEPVSDTGVRHTPGRTAGVQEGVREKRTYPDSCESGL